MAKGVAIVSGGMDSVVLAHMLAEKDEMHLLSFNYGQRHGKELIFARECSEEIGAKWDLIDLHEFGSLLKGSALTDNIDVPHGRYDDESMKVTVVPNRNAIMLALATGVAVAEGASYVATGVHAGDHAIYPDCRPLFIHRMSDAMIVANEGFAVGEFRIIAPFVTMGKEDICALGNNLSTPVDHSMTWSCYEGGEVHCGKCGTCVERKEAFQLSDVPDPTVYAS